MDAVVLFLSPCRDALASCHHLSHLNIGYNRIRKVDNTDFKRWAEHLDTLILRNNRLTELGPRAFKGCPRLRELSLSFNAFDHIDGEAFKDIALSLESLEISFGYRDRRFPEAAVKPLQKLMWLSLDNNELEDISSTALYPLGELQYLNLEGNRLSRLPPDLFNKNVHRRLLDVRLSYNRLTSLPLGTFSALTGLQTVVLTGNRIEFVGSGAFRHLPNLVTVILTHNR